MLNDSGNMPSETYLMSYISEIVSIVYTDLGVVCRFTLFGNHNKAYVAICFSSGIYSISGPYYPMISIYHNNQFVIRFLHIILL